MKIIYVQWNYIHYLYITDETTLIHRVHKFIYFLTKPDKNSTRSIKNQNDQLGETCLIP